ncbi:MAG: DNA-protecting protein DprA [Deltaproteobacteria bacterium]|nr:MAG: DNA-protecting protein DprA [Deltaproteobacteria bacterium]
MQPSRSGADRASGVGVIEPFWAGARRFARGAELGLLAARLGGREQVARAALPDLLAVGVPKGRAEAWLGEGEARTLGTPLTWSDPRYPPALRPVPDPPAVLCVEGDPGLLRSSAVAVVGTRTCTPYGAAVARHLGQALSARGIVVVSGLARGIDTHAHRAALRAGQTLAVLGHGLATTAPPSNRPLRRSIVEAGGAIVSAYPDDLSPARWTFPQRNAWIAGLSQAVVVVEAPLRSGALITATESAAIGREVWAVPGRLGEPSSAGCLRLLADGAQVVDDVESFADRFGSRQAELGDPVLFALRDGPTAQALAERLELPVATVLARLAALEVEGRVVRLSGHRFGLA